MKNRTLVILLIFLFVILTSSCSSEDVKEDAPVLFNQKFVDEYVPLGVPTIMKEIKELEEAGEYDIINDLLYRSHQPDLNIPVLEEQTVSGTGVVIGTNTTASEKGTVTAELYIGEYDFDYEKGIIPATEKLLQEHPEEWCKFISITANEYMQIEIGDKVQFEGTIYGIQNDTMHLKGMCYKK